MRDFRASDPAAMADSPLRDTVRHYKETEKGVSSMCKELEKIVEEAETKGMEKGMEKGQATGRLAQLHDLVKKGLLTLSTAAREAGMTEDAFRKAAML
jgi:flagellar biosynthesis/type III secretory pathway protein FliH